MRFLESRQLWSVAPYASAQTAAAQSIIFMPHTINSFVARMPTPALQQPDKSAAGATPAPSVDTAMPVPAQISNAAPQPMSEKAASAWNTANFKMASGMRLSAEDMDALPCNFNTAFPVPAPRDLMFIAVAYGQVEHVEQMLRDGASATAPNSEGLSPVVAAATLADPAMLKAMIEADVDINAAQPRNGATPLIAAAESSHADNVALLIKAGADPLATASDGSTAMSVSTSPAISLMLEMAGNLQAANG
ncbi:ankyrin repeat domain-containing protein [Stenotrophomonas sp. CFBP 13725]|uniref:ankyrin repeat domain-containing protein n=1 Tax=Stenotrophomonas sp. CFBP 13725 TaxID=2775297 RepID=UPI00178653F7|nr:ankyrin repeat domain-containing protein [Stenotrophomonas sp. CFBP 13725]